MKNQRQDMPTLINCITGKPLTEEDLYNPRVMGGVFEQMAHEVWRFAPLDPLHQYQKFLPFDYVLHRLTVYLDSLHLIDPGEIIAPVALDVMMDRVFKHGDRSEVTLSLRA